MERVEEEEGKLENVRVEYNELLDKKTDIESEIEDLRSKQSSLSSEFHGTEQRVEASESRLKDIEERINILRRERESLSNEISDRAKDLKSLEDDINLFPTEISEFIKEGARNIGQYRNLAFIPILLILVISGLLVFNAANLTTIFERKEDVSIISIFVTRLPYVIIAAAILGVCYRLAVRFIDELIRINNQKMNLVKISIIASDVAFASEEGLELSDEQRYLFRTHLKMELLKDHMKQYISSNFEFKKGMEVSNLVSEWRKNKGGAGSGEKDDELDDGEASPEN